MGLPKPYPPTRITYLNWNTVIDYVEAHSAFHEPGGADEIHNIDILNTGTLLSAHASRHEPGAADAIPTLASHEARHVRGGADDIDSDLDARALAMTTQGDLATRAAAANTLQRIGIGADGQVLRAGGAGTVPAWVNDEQAPDWILYRDGATYYAKNGQTGEIAYSGANFVTDVWDNVVGSNRHIHFKSDTFVIDDDLDITACGQLYVSFSRSIIEQSTFDRNHFHLQGACWDITFRGPANFWFSDALMPVGGACFMIGDGTNGIWNLTIKDVHFGGGNAVMGGGVFASGNIFFRGLHVADKVYALWASEVMGNECVHDFILVGNPKSGAGVAGGNHIFVRCGCDNTNFADDGVAVDGTTFPVNANGDGCSTGTGIHVRKSQGTWFTDCGMNRFTRGIYLDPDADDYCDHIRFTDCDADACDQEGIRIADDNATTGRIWNIRFIRPYAGGNNNQGIVLDETNEVREVVFVGGEILFNYNEGVRLNTGPEFIQFNACIFRGNNVSNTGKYNVYIEPNVYFYFTECLWLNTSYGGLDLYLADWCSSFRITGQTIATFTQNFPMVGGYPATDHQAYWVSLTGWGNTKTDLIYEVNAQIIGTSLVTPVWYGGAGNPISIRTDISGGAGVAYLERMVVSVGALVTNIGNIDFTPGDGVTSIMNWTTGAILVSEDITFAGAGANTDIGTAANYADDVYADTYYIKTPGAGAAHVTAFDGFDDLALIDEIYPTKDGNLIIREKYGIVEKGFINQMVERSLFVGAFKQIKTHRDETDEKIAGLMERVALLEQQLGSG